MIVSQTRIGSVARKEEEMGKSNRIKPRSKKKIYQNLNFFVASRIFFAQKWLPLNARLQHLQFLKRQV